MADKEVATQLSAIGVGLLSPPAALSALGAAMACNRGQVVVANIKWEQFREVYEIRGAAHLLANMPAPIKSSEPSLTPGTETLLASKLKACTPPEQAAIALKHVMQVLSEVLKLPADTSVSAQTGFADLGVDSLMAINLRRRLTQDLGVDLAATVIFDYPDGERLADHLIVKFRRLYSSAPVQTTDSAIPVDSNATAELERKLGQLGF